MTRPKFGLDYSSCSSTELRRFIKDRNGTEPKRRGGKKPAKKQQLIRILRKLDRNMEGFRFLDLPAEMRNEVYELLLVHIKEEGSKAYTELLRTCKEIYEEARSVLHDLSIVDLNAVFTERWRFQNFAESIGGRRLMRPGTAMQLIGGLSFERTYHENDTWTPIDFFRLQFQGLARIRTIHLHLVVHGKSEPRFGRRSLGFWPEKLPNIFLRALVDVCQGVRFLKVTVVQMFDGQERDVNYYTTIRMLRRLAFLSREVTLCLRGLPKTTYDCFWQNVKRWNERASPQPSEASSSGLSSLSSVSSSDSS